MNKTSILVTGGAGFIGSALVEALAQKPEQHVVVVDNLLTGSKEKLPSSPNNNIEFVEGDVNNWEDISALFNKHTFDYVFHYAAMVGVERTQQNPISVFEDIDGIRHIIHLSHEKGVKRVYFSSSSEVYGEPFEIPQHEETTPLNSRVPYAIVKNVGEAYLRAFNKEHGLEYTIFRFFNTYGPKQSKDFVVSVFISNALRNEPLLINGDGLQTRTFCYIDDNIDSCLTAFYENRHVNDVVNIGGENEVTMKELAEEIIQITNSASPIQYGPAREEGDMTRRKPDVRKMKALLNREPLPLDEGIKKILADTRYIV